METLFEAIKDKYDSKTLSSNAFPEIRGLHTWVTIVRNKGNNKWWLCYKCAKQCSDDNDNLSISKLTFTKKLWISSSVFVLAHSAKTNSSFLLSVLVACLSGFLKISADLKTKSLKHSRPQNSYIRSNRDCREELVKHGSAGQLIFEQNIRHS